MSSLTVNTLPDQHYATAGAATAAACTPLYLGITVYYPFTPPAKYQLEMEFTRTCVLPPGAAAGDPTVPNWAITVSLSASDNKNNWDPVLTVTYAPTKPSDQAGTQKTAAAANLSSPQNTVAQNQLIPAMQTAANSPTSANFDGVAQGISQLLQSA
jgi:hypothetical protein